MKYKLLGNMFGHFLQFFAIFFLIMFFLFLPIAGEGEREERRGEMRRNEGELEGAGGCQDMKLKLRTCSF
jgi:hypothetical protein